MSGVILSEHGVERRKWRIERWRPDVPGEFAVLSGQRCCLFRAESLWRAFWIVDAFERSYTTGAMLPDPEDLGMWTGSKGAFKKHVHHMLYGVSLPGRVTPFR